MTKQTFVFSLPPYDAKSNGVRIIYDLAKYFEEFGHRVLVTPHNELSLSNNHFVHGEHGSGWDHVKPSEIEHDWIPIFSDTALPFFTDKFNTRFRIWYLLNKPFALTSQGCQYRPLDLICCYSRFISQIYPIFFFNSEISGINQRLQSVKPLGQRKNWILFYIGKSCTTKISDAVNQLANKHNASIITINRAVPEKREKLLDLLQSARLLVTSDPVTNLNYEATLLGTPCFVADNYTFTDYSNYELPLHGISDDPTLLEEMYLRGIDADTHRNIVHAYKSSTGNHKHTASVMCQTIVNHVNQYAVEPSQQETEKLDAINALRLENDRLNDEIRHLKRADEPDLAVGFSYKPFLNLFVRLKFVLLFLQAGAIYFLMRATVNRQIASEFFHRLNNEHRQALARRARLSQLKSARNKKK